MSTFANVKASVKENKYTFKVRDIVQVTNYPAMSANSLTGIIRNPNSHIHINGSIGQIYEINNSYYEPYARLKLSNKKALTYFMRDLKLIQRGAIELEW